MSLSTVIQGLLVSQLPEYEISNEAIGYLSDFSGKVLNKLVKESAINNSSISYPEVKVAITKVFPQSWAPLVFREVSNQVSHQQPDDKESMLKNEISDFELIDDGNLSPKVENKHAENLFLSADFIKSYLPASVASRIDSHGCMYLAVSLETVLSKLIQHARRVLENHEDPFVITKEAIERAIYQDTSLTELSNAMSRCPEPSEVDEFEVVEDDEKVSELEFKSQVEEQVNEFIETEEPKYAAEEPAQVSELDSSSVEDDHEVPEPTVKEESTVPEEDEVPAIAVPEVTTSDVEEDVPVGIQQPEEPLVAKESDISEPVDADIPSVSESETLLEPSVVELVNLDPSSAKLIKAKKPVTELYGKCCPYFDATSFAIHMLSSIVELFLLHLVSETCGIARPQRRAVKQHVREAFARLTSSQNEIPHSDDSSLFNECVDNSITIVSKQVEWDTDVKTYISDIIMYISSRVLLVAATHARTTGDWVINSNCIASAASHVIPAAPVNKLVKTLKETLEGEGPIITPPPAPRIRAAEMIYLTSLYKETPLQIDNQLLVVFMFLVSLSLHTLCCVK